MAAARDLDRIGTDVPLFGCLYLAGIAFAVLATGADAIWWMLQ